MGNGMNPKTQNKQMKGISCVGDKGGRFGKNQQGFQELQQGKERKGSATRRTSHQEKNRNGEKERFKYVQVKDSPNRRRRPLC